MDALFLRLRGFYHDRNHYWTGNYAGRCFLHLVLLPGSWHEEAANTVRHIFRLCLDGYGPSQIADILHREKVETPSVHFRNMGINHPAKVQDDPYHWNADSVADILDRIEYLGHTVNFRTEKLNYKEQ